MMGVQVFGRETELRSTTAFVQRMLRGPEVLALHGDAGIGKTTLWEEAVQSARDAGCRVLTARPTEIEGQLAHSGLMDLFAALAEERDYLEQLPLPQGRALAAALLLEDPSGGRSDPRAVVAATMTLLGRLALAAPVVVAVDDIQWLDPATFRIVESIARRMDVERLGILVAERGAALPDRSTRLFLAVPKARFTAVRLDGLPSVDLRRIVERQVGWPVPLSAARRIERISRGNPFFALELAVDLPSPGTTTGFGVPLSRTLREMVTLRLSALDETTRLGLLVAAATPSPTVAQVAVGMDVHADQALEALESAVDAGVAQVDPGTYKVTFEHPLYAAGVYALASPAVRRLVHRRLAQVADSTETRARHLASAQVEPDSGLADLIDDAAIAAVARGAADSAAELAVQACRLTPADRPRDLVRRRLSEARFRFQAGELETVRVLVEAVLAEARSVHVASSVAADATCLLGEVQYLQESYAAAMESFHRAAQYAPGDPDVACRISLHLAYACANTGAYAEAPEHAHAALAFSEQLDNPALRAEALASTTIAAYLVGRGLDEPRMRQALTLEDPFHRTALPLRPQLIAGNLMLFEGRLEEAVNLLTCCRQAATDRDEESDISLVESDLAWAESCRGRLVVAEQHARTALRLARRIRSPGAEGAAHSKLVMVHAYRGNEVEAREHADQAMYLAEAAGSAAVTLWTRWGLGVLALGREDPEGVHAALEPAVRHVERHGLVEPVLAMYLADEIEALIGLGQFVRADALLETFRDCAVRLDRGWALVGAWRARALLAEARGELDEAAQAAALSLKHGDGIEHRLEVARTLLVAGVIDRRRKHRHDARALLESALDIFERSSADIWAARTRGQIARLGQRAKASGDLTASEQRVAELAASGLTNREVALKVNISPKTVESNLARVYRKLGISTRAELGALLG